MNFLDSLIDVVAETFARAEWVAIFLSLVGVYWLLLAWSGLRYGHTRGFGWRSPEWTGPAAQLAGRVWGVGAAALIIAAAAVWTLKA